MNAQDYIASGLLEAYVLGALSGTEAAEVQMAISRYPEVAAEVAAIEETMFLTAQQGAIAPPAGLQQQIWEQIAPQDQQTAAPAGNNNITTPRTIPLDGRRSNVWLRAAIWAALIASLAGNYYLYSGQQQTREEYTALRQRFDDVSAHQAAMDATLARYQQEADMMADPDMKPVVMQTTQKSHPMAATIYWSKTKGEAYVSVQKLPMPPKGKQYQLWAIADGKPVDLGVLRNDMIGRSGMEKVAKLVADGQAFAISLEKEGGNPTPTMDQIFVIGKVI